MTGKPSTKPFALGIFLPHGRIARTLFIRTLSIALLLGLAVAGGYTVYDYGYEKEMAATGAREALGLSREAATRASYDLDPTLAFTIIDSLRATGRFDHLELIDDFGKTLSRWQSPKPDTLLDRAARVFYQAAPEIVVPLVGDGDQALGRLTGAIAQTPPFRNWLRHMASTFLLIPLATLVAAAMLAELFHRTLTRPLTKLAETIGSGWIENGEPLTLDIPEKHRGDELGVVIETINSASSALRDVNGALRDAMEKLHRSESRFRSYFDNAPEGIFISGTDGRYVDANPAGCTLVGRTHEEMLECTILDIADPSEREWQRELFAGLLETGAVNREIALRRKDDVLVYVWLSAVRLADDTVIGFCQDTTGRRAHEAALEEAKSVAEEANAAKSQFLANMSHELRTPLNSVIGFAGAMTAEIWGPLPPRYMEYTRLISQSGEHLLGIIGDLLDMSRIEAGKTELSIVPVDYWAILSDVLSIVRPQAEANTVQIHTAPPPDPLEIRADPVRIRQILINLMSNAVKFSPGGSVTVSVGRDDRFNRIEIADTGIGMSPEDIATALQPFGQVESRTEIRRFPGTGLGLPLANQLVELHGGHLDIRSVPGAGTTVTVSLPK